MFKFEEDIIQLFIYTSNPHFRTPQSLAGSSCLTLQVLVAERSLLSSPHRKEDWQSSAALERRFQMVISREAIVFVVISCIVATVAGFGEDGLPRPTNFPDAPTTSYGPEPEITYPDGSLVDCTWYGFANEQYDVSIGEKCLEDLREGLMNSTDVLLEPFMYYFSAGPTGSDPATKEPFCYEGCFNVNGGALPPDSGAFPPSYFDGPAPAPVDGYIRGPTLAPYYWPGTPPAVDFAPPPMSGA